MGQRLTKQAKRSMILELVNRYNRVEFFRGELEKQQTAYNNAIIARNEFQVVCRELGITIGEMDEALGRSSSHT